MADTTIPAPTAAPDVDPDTHHVQLDLNPTGRELLTTLARVITGNPALAAEFYVLGHNRGPRGTLVAAGALLEDPAVQYALRPSITPDAATNLADELQAASMEPEPCAGCGKHADPFRDDDLCANCAALNEEAAELHTVRRTA